MGFERSELARRRNLDEPEAPDRPARTVGVELREIEIFLTLADELHFGRTAERLYLSRSRVSQTIRLLETQLGGRLFERTSRRVELTPLGEHLRAALQPPYDQIHQALAAARAAAGGITGALRISLLSAVAGGPAFADITRAFRERYPGCEVTVFEAFPGEALGRLRRGELDVMAHWLPLADPGLTVGPLLMREERALAVPEDHPLAVRGHATLEDLADLVVPDAVGIMPEETLVALCPRSTPSGRPMPRGPGWGRVVELLVLGPGIGAASVAGSIASLTGVAETEAGLASGLNNASFQIGGAVGVAILSTVAVSGAHGPNPLAALTNGYQTAFATAIAIAALGTAAATLLLGKRHQPDIASEAEPALA